MYRNFTVQLMRQIEGQWVTIKAATIKEYDGDCLDANLFYSALDAFEQDLQPWDVIKTWRGCTQLRPDEDGTLKYVSC